MKVEMGESLVLSWLRHVQRCMAVQLNWKPSPTWELEEEARLTEGFDAIRAFVNGRDEICIFKDISFRQFIRQAEIDALGLRFNRASVGPAVFAVDSAFHENGLQYGGSEETVARVLKKLVRSAFACRAYFRAQQVRVVFATPKMHPGTRDTVERRLAELASWLRPRWGLGSEDLRFHVVANEDFTREILQPVLRCVPAVADTSELFLRAQQLVALCDAASGEREIRPRRSKPERGEGGEKIGAHVRSVVTDLAMSGRLTPEMARNLLDVQYCKTKFRLGWPFLKKVNPLIALSQQMKDDKGYARFWKAPLTIGSEQYLVCNQWFEWQRDRFEAWVRELGLTSGRHTPR